MKLYGKVNSIQLGVKDLISGISAVSVLIFMETTYCPNLDLGHSPCSSGARLFIYLKTKLGKHK